jgi:hypothetical protein
MRLLPAGGSPAPRSPAIVVRKAHGRRIELAFFVAAYVVYNAARWLFVVGFAAGRLRLPS